jgi:protein SCO1/2
MRRKIVFYIVFFLVLVIGFYAALTQVIPGYGKVKLPVLTYVQPFHYENQDKKMISERDVEGKVYVAEFFFTTCKSICPIMNRNLGPIHEAFKNEPRFLILSHTCDPETDSSARLKVYADSIKADTKSWWFLTGRKDSLYSTARNSYLLDDPKNNLQSIEDQFLHTQFLALVDKSGRVRKIYDGLKKDELQELQKDIQGLLDESIDQKRFSNNIFGN